MAKGAFGLPGIQVRGRLGGMVFVPQPGGRMTVRRAPARVPLPTERQAAGTARFRPVAEAWNLLSIEEARAWRRYGQGLGAKPDGRAVQANNAFTALGAKCLQMRPGEGVPRLPPTEGFLGGRDPGLRLHPLPHGSPFRSCLPARGTLFDLRRQRAERRGDRDGDAHPAAEVPAADARRGSVPLAGVRGVRGGRAGGVGAVRAGRVGGGGAFRAVDTGQETAVVPLGVIEV